MADQNTTQSSQKTNNSVGDSFALERYMTPIAILLGLVIIALALYFGHGLQPNANSAAQTASTTAAAQGTPVNIANVKTAGEPYVGSATAPVTMALYFDYQCPYCKQFDQTVLNQIYTNYVQTGKVKVIFKNFDFIGPDSYTAAYFGLALWQLYPNDYYTWITDMFAAQDEENTGFGDLPSIEKLAATIPGVNVNNVVALMNKNMSTYEADAAADRAEGTAFGIQGTPSVIIGTTLLQGGQTYATVSALLDAQLKAQ